MTPGNLAMLDAAMRFRAAARVEYLDLFLELARTDLEVGPVPADPAAQDARWHELHRMLAAQFGPFAQWQVLAPAPGSKPLKAEKRLDRGRQGAEPAVSPTATAAAEGRTL